MFILSTIPTKSTGCKELRKEWRSGIRNQNSDRVVIGRGGFYLVYQTQWLHEQLHKQGRPDQPDLQWCTRNQATDPGILTIKDTDAKQKAWLTRQPAGWFLRESTILPVSYSSMAVKPRWWTCTMVRDAIVGESWMPTVASGCHINEKTLLSWRTRVRTPWINV